MVKKVYFSGFYKINSNFWKYILLIQPAVLSSTGTIHSSGFDWKKFCSMLKFFFEL